MKVTKVYTIEELLKTSKYLLNVEDKIPPGMFVGGRDTLKLLVDFNLLLTKFKKNGAKLVMMSYDSDMPKSVHEPFVKYYIWIHRLRTMTEIKPI